MLKNSIASGAIFFLTHAGLAACSHLFLLPRKFHWNNISFINDFKKKANTYMFAGVTKDMEITSINDIKQSANFKKKWDYLCTNAENENSFKEEAPDNILYIMVKYSIQTMSDISKFYQNNIPVQAELENHSKFLNAIVDNTISLEIFYKVIFVNLFIDLDKAMAPLKAILNKGRHISPLKVKKHIMNNKGDKEWFPEYIMGCTVYKRAMLKIVDLFAYLDNHPDEEKEIAYKRIFNCFEILYCIYRLTQTRFEAPGYVKNFTSVLAYRLKSIRFAILEYLGSEYFEDNDTSFKLETLAKKEIASSNKGTDKKENTKGFLHSKNNIDKVKGVHKKDTNDNFGNIKHNFKKPSIIESREKDETLTANGKKQKGANCLSNQYLSDTASSINKNYKNALKNHIKSQVREEKQRVINDVSSITYSFPCPSMEDLSNHSFSSDIYFSLMDRDAKANKNNLNKKNIEIAKQPHS